MTGQLLEVTEDRITISQDFKDRFVAELKNFKKGKKGYKLTIAIDAEWDSQRKLTVGYALVVEAQYVFVVLNSAIKDREKFPEVTEAIIERLENYCQEKEWIPYWKNLNDDASDTTSDILREYDINKGSFDVLLFYSPKDLRVAFGTKNLEPYFNQGKITQKRRVAGNYRNDELKYRIRDLKGWSNTTLKGFAASVGVEMPFKEKMDFYKEQMLDGLIAEPEIFLEYMVEDTICLFEIREEFVSNIRELQHKIIGRPGVLEIEEIPIKAKSNFNLSI